MNDFGTHGTSRASSHAHAGFQGRRPVFTDVGSAIAAVVSLIALLFSGYTFYETVLKQAELRVYTSPLIHMYRQDFRDVFAIPVTISNDGAQRGTVLSFDLDITHRTTGQTQRFQNLHFGASPRGDVKLFTPITVAGGGSYSNVVLFHALETGSFVETTGGVELPLRLTLKLNVDQSDGWFGLLAPPPVTFAMTANFIASLRDMESGRPTQLHDARWTAARAKAKAAE
jgi:hypothetical protein